MRTLAVILPFAIAATLSGCSTTPGGDSYSTELQALAEECRERGGILQTTGGVPTGEARADNACRINGGASRLDE